MSDRKKMNGAVRVRMRERENEEKKGSDRV
jgi:hypothetical protein